jgi:hypothetical protein
MATLLFISSGWLIHTGRYGAGYGVTALTVLALLALFVWMSSTEHTGRAALIFALVSTIALFTPGGLWLLLAGSLVCRKAISKQLKATPLKSIIGSSLILGLGLALIATTLVQDPGLIRQWIGLPDDTPTLLTLAKQALTGVTAYTVRGPFLPEVWLAHTPLLDAASSILLITGIIFYSRHTRNVRTLLLLAFFAIGIVLVMFNSSAALGYLAPIAYLIIAGGLAYFTHQWQKVFPKNPIAKGIGLALQP